MSDPAREDAPTRLTMAMLFREVASLESKLGIRIDALHDAQAKFEENLVRVPTEVQKAVGSLKELHGQRFDAIDARLVERDSRRAAEKQAAEAALAAALQATKELSTSQDIANAEALRKAQESVNEQIGSIRSILDTRFGAIGDQIAAINSRLDRGEGMLGGGRERQTDQRLNTGLLVGAASLVVAIILASVAVITLVK